MRTRLLLIAAPLASIAVLAGLSYLYQQRQTAARRLAAWEEEVQSLAANNGLERLVTLQGGRLKLEDFAELMAAEVGLPVELDLAAIEAKLPPTVLYVQAPTGTLSLRSAFRLALAPLGL